MAISGEENRMIYYRGSPFAQVSNKMLRDKEIPTRVKGLYSIIISFVTMQGFKLSYDSVRNFYNEGITAFKTDWKELQERGYIVKKQGRKNNGQIYYCYEVYDEPVQLTNVPLTGNLTTAPLSGEPPTAGTTANIILNNNTYIKRKYIKENPPRIEEIEQYCNEKGADINVSKFYEYYKSRGWCDKRGSPITSWKQKVWIWNEPKNTSEKERGEVKDESKSA